jgi:hypothetical protein
MNRPTNVEQTQKDYEFARNWDMRLSPSEITEMERLTAASNALQLSANWYKNPVNMSLKDLYKVWASKNLETINDIIKFMVNIGDYSKYLSPAFIYINRPNGLLNQGMYLSDACDILSNIGTCTDETFGYSSIDPNIIYTLTPNNIPDNAKNEANKYRTSNAVLVKTIDQLKTALYINGPCIFGVNVYGWKHAMWVPWDLSNLAYGLKGAHCMAFVGYNDKGFLVRNSWGVDWNKEYWIEQGIKDSGGYDL